FDGENDHLRATGLGASLRAFTVFLVTAPHQNPGGFRGFLAANAKGGRDYETGFTIDMHFAPTIRFEQVNVEGRGFGGASDLMGPRGPFGELRVLRATADPDNRLVAFTVAGADSRERRFDPATISADEITVGARYYTNGPGPQQVRGFLSGDIAEVLVYDRALGADEAEKVQKYLAEKYATLRAELPAALREAGITAP